MSTRADALLVGRERELDAVHARLASAAAGTREAILVEGEAGIGKTRLISECATCATDAGFTVIQAAADDTEQARDFGVLLRAFQSYSPSHVDRLASLPSESADRRLAFVDSLVSILEEATRAAPIALMLDDLQWADNETVHALRALVRRTASIPFVLVGTCRPAVDDPELEALIETVAYEGLHLDLAPLDDTAVAALVRELGGASLSPEALARVASAHGNPFFVMEIVANMGEGLESSDLSKGLRRTVLRRIIRLSDDARSLLRVSSLLGTAIDAQELAVVTGRPVAELVAPLDEAMKAKVLEDNDGSMTFRHEIVREAIYRDMPGSVRDKLHRDAARALAASGAPARRVATHLGAAAESGDGEAISWLRRAAAEEMQRSPSLAADMLGRAVTLMTPDESVRDEVQAERVQALLWAGRVSEASTLATDVLSTVRDATLGAHVRVSLGQALFFQGRVQEAGDHFQPAATDAAGSERGLILAQGALAVLLSGQIHRADGLARASLELSTTTSDPRAMSLATAVQGACLLAQGDSSAPEIARSAVQIAEDDFLGEAHRYGSPAILGFALAETDSFDAAEIALRRGIDIDQQQGITWALPVYHGLLGLQHYYRGDWDDSVAELETLKGLHDDMDSYLFGPLAHGVLANIAVHRDDLDRAEAEIVWGEGQLAERGPQEGAEYLINARILLAEASGDIASALALAKTACQLAQGMGVLLAFRYFAPTFARLAQAVGVPDDCRFAVEAAERYAERSGIPSAMGSALMSRGMLAGDPNLLLDAVEILAEGYRPLELAAAHEEAGVGFARQREAARAAEHLQAAADVYERLGARLDMKRVARELEGAGGRSKRVRVRRPVTGWGSLSPTEHRVALLVADGLSNGAIALRLAVSRRTVETHVYHVFQKLGVSSRVELAARAARNAEAAEVR